MSVLLEQPKLVPRECAHDRTDLLGSEGTATFYRCPECGSVVVLQHGHRWVLKASLLP